MSTSRIYRMRRAVYYCAGGLMLVSFLPHAAPSLITRSCELRGKQAPEQLVAHVRKIAAAMDLPHPEHIRVFLTNGFSSISGGCTLLPRGAVIGLPRTVLFHGPADVFESGMVVDGKPVDWYSSTGKKLATLMTPSTQMINFRIAHEVGHLKHFDLLPSVLLPPFVLVLGYHFSALLPKYALPQRYATTSFPLLFSLVLLLYVHLSTSIRHWQEFRADRAAALSHKSYTQGGIKLMQTHIELESLLRRPPRKYSLEHFVSTNFSSHPPFTERLSRLEDINSLTHS